MPKNPYGYWQSAICCQLVTALKMLRQGFPRRTTLLVAVNFKKVSAEVKRRRVKIAWRYGRQVNACFETRNITAGQ